MIPQAMNYAGHVIYEDGRVYKNYELLKTCASLRSAKRWATINQRAYVRTHWGTKS